MFVALTMNARKNADSKSHSCAAVPSDGESHR